LEISVDISVHDACRTKVRLAFMAWTTYAPSRLFNLLQRKDWGVVEIFDQG